MSALSLLALLGQVLAPSVRVAAPSASGPAVVVLLKDGCPCARECRFALNALANACRGRVRFVGLVDGDARRASLLAKEAELRFPVLPDPKGETIGGLKGKEGLDLRLIGRDGRIAGSWDGLNRANVAALVLRLRAVTGKTIVVDEAPFTTLPKLGCAFDASAKGQK